MLWFDRCNVAAPFRNLKGCTCTGGLLAGAGVTETASMTAARFKLVDHPPKVLHADIVVYGQTIDHNALIFRSLTSVLPLDKSPSFPEVLSPSSTKEYSKAFSPSK